MSQHYLVVHSGYHAVSIGVYRDGHLLGVQSLDKKTVSAFLMPSILGLLAEHQLTFKGLSFIAAHSGPAPFTTLRVGIVTANGIGFATGLPLIGVNGLEALSLIYPEYTVILNAFADDIYVGRKGEISCENIEAFLAREASTSTTPVTYIGNAVALHQEKLQAVLGSKAEILADYPYEADIETIAQAAYRKWLDQQDITQQILPIYLKQYSVRIG